MKLEDLFQTTVPSDDGLRLSLGQEIVDAIVKNTEEDKLDADGEPLKSPYSKGYVDSLKFKAFGKSQSNVNMTLTGAMMDAVQVDSFNDDEIVIGFGGDKLQSNKAHGHITGAVSKGKFKRDFFGLPDDDLVTIGEEFQEQVDTLNEGDAEEPSALELFLLEQLRRTSQASPFGNGDPFG